MADKPITRKELFLAKAGGQDVKTPEPITREERFLAAIAEGGGSGGGSGLPEITTEPVVIMPQATLSFTAYQGLYTSQTDFVADDGSTYVISWDGVDYTCTALTQGGMFALGNMAMIGGPDTGEPFLITNAMGNGAWFTQSTAATHLCGITQERQTPPNKAILIVEDGEWKTEPIKNFTSAAIVSVKCNVTISVGANAGIAIGPAPYTEVLGLPNGWTYAAGFWGKVYRADNSESYCYCTDVSILPDGTFTANIKNPQGTSATFSGGFMIETIMVGY